VIDTRNIPAVVHGKTTTTHVNPFDAHNNDTIKPIEAAKTIDLPIVVERIEAKTSYKHCVDILVHVFHLCMPKIGRTYCTF
jgi:hypothetical protein